EPAVLLGPCLGLDPDALEKSREALVEPPMRPVATGQKIPEPLMRELMRDQRIAREIRMRARVVQGEIGLRRVGSVFHSPEDVILDGDLAALLVRVLEADLLLVGLDHLRGIAERALSVLFAPRGDEILHR